MFRLVSISLLLVLGAALGASAQDGAVPMDPLDDPAVGTLTVAPSLISPTPEMWFYQQEMDRYDNPQQVVRLNAMARAEERRSRLAALKWYGFSNSRPQAHPFPWAGNYSPAWVGNHRYPYQWAGPANSVIGIHVGGRAVRP